MLFSCVNLVKVTYLFSTALVFTSIIFRISNISILFCVVYMCWCMVYAYVRVCVCVHVCIWVYVSMTRAFVWRTQTDVFLNCSPLYFSRQGLTEPGVYRFSSAGWPVSARKVCLSCHAPLCPAYDVALGPELVRVHSHPFTDGADSPDPSCSMFWDRVFLQNPSAWSSLCRSNWPWTCSNQQSSC